MREGLLAAEVERFRALVARHLGLAFDESRTGFLAEVLGRQASAAGRAPHEFLQGLEAPTRDVVAALALELTVSETYFFRNAEQFAALAEAVLPAAMRSGAGRRRLRLCSLGCASGEEPYSLAMLLRDRMPETVGWEVDIVAVDVNAAALERARRGRYSAWSLRETPAEVARRWFTPDGRDQVLSPAIREMVQLAQVNLVAPDEALFAPGSFDVVFCRNTLMYLTLAAQRRLVASIARALTPGGTLFLGHAETLRGLSSAFDLRHTHGTFYYQRKGGEAASPPPPARVPALEVATCLADASWVETIRQASERVKAISDAHSEAASAHLAATSAGVPGPGDLGWAFEMLREERFVEARDRLRTLPPERARDPDALLLRAVLCTNGGDLHEAEHVLHALLALDTLSAGAHYLMALCREDAGDRRGAIEHDRTAIYLDPTFAMPRLHLGLLARRGGDRDGAQRELGEALVLLRREDPSRLLLFGGGFGRDALIALCQAQLAAVGGGP